MKLENKIMLITYADSMGKSLKDLSQILNKHFKGVIGGIHILPFFPSSDDRGFSPMTYEVVDPAFGTWEDVEEIGKDFFLMYDFMINHISRSSEYFKDFLKNKDESPYKDYFIRYKDFWEGGEPTESQIDLIYKRKPRAPYIEAEFSDGTTEKIWCTFGEEQIDLNVDKEATKDFIKNTLKGLCKRGAALIRLDAFAYTAKKPDTSCFFVEPETWDLLKYVENILAGENAELLPEIHEHYSIQMKLAQKDYYVYDFALPMLVLHTLYSKDSSRLVNWLKICPRKQFTTLDTHDGIGVVDVKDLLSDAEIEMTRENLYKTGANVKMVYSSAAYKNLDIYQINCTYYSALGNNDDAYLLARAIQFFTPGIPQVYYVGLLAGANDIELVEKTRNGRDINRHNYKLEEIDEEVKRPVLQKLFKLMKFRNEHPAFNGEITVIDKQSPNELEITWKNGEHSATLRASLETRQFSIEYTVLDTFELHVLSL